MTATVSGPSPTSSAFTKLSHKAISTKSAWVTLENQTGGHELAGWVCRGRNGMESNWKKEGNRIGQSDISPRMSIARTRARTWTADVLVNVMVNNRLQLLRCKQSFRKRDSWPLWIWRQISYPTLRTQRAVKMTTRFGGLIDRPLLL